jgi:hypothetical protein
LEFIWSNDDIDRLHTFDDSAADSMDDIDETEEDDIGPEEAQNKLMSADCWTNNKADSKRDLEDFTRIQIYTAGLNESFKNGQLFLGLKWTDVAGDPAIRVYKHLDPAGGLGYLTDETTATAQMAEYANRFDETSTLGELVEGVTDGTHFDRGEWTAWRSGAPLRQLLQTLSGAYNGQPYVFSHSMGGIVMSEALRLQSDAGGGQITNVYVASQAALSVHLYDGTLSAENGSAHAVQWEYNHPSLPNGSPNYGPQTTNIYRNWLAYLLSGSATSSSAVGTLVNFYNQNDWALAAPVWQFNQIAKPDWPDGTLQPWTYGYAGDPAVFGDVFIKTGGDLGSNQTALHLGTRTNPQDRHEIMAFAAESYVKSFGATPNVSQGVTRSFNVRSIWPTDSGDHKGHIWHSGQFRSHMPKQKNYWKALLSDQAFDITTTTLP